MNKHTNFVDTLHRTETKIAKTQPNSCRFRLATWSWCR